MYHSYVSHGDLYIMYFVTNSSQLRNLYAHFALGLVWLPTASIHFPNRADGPRHRRDLRSVPRFAHPTPPFGHGVDRLYGRTHYLSQRHDCAAPCTSLPFPLLSP